MHFGKLAGQFSCFLVGVGVSAPVFWLNDLGYGIDVTLVM